MAKIVINEISQNYTYNVGNNTYATVAFPITACWGPAYSPKSFVENANIVPDVDATYPWRKFRSTPEGVESFVSTYRGPSSNYRVTKDYSYQLAMTLLSAGYDILVCRVCPGVSGTATVYNVPATWIGNSTTAVTDSGTESPTINGTVVALADIAVGSAVSYQATGDVPKLYEVQEISNAKSWKLVGEVPTLQINAKHPGSFSDSLYVELKRVGYGNQSDFWTMITYIGTSSSSFTAVENCSFVLDPDHVSDSIPYYTDVDSSFVSLVGNGSLFADGQVYGSTFAEGKVRLLNGTDTVDATPYGDTVADILVNGVTAGTYHYQSAKEFAAHRYDATSSPAPAYLAAIAAFNADKQAALTALYKEWVYSAAYDVYDGLTDRLTYNPNRVISPGWDDQKYSDYEVEVNPLQNAATITVSPLHKKLMDTAFFSRCATAYIDIPRDTTIKYVQDYADALSAYISAAGGASTNGIFYATNSALFAPWGQFTYVTTSKMNTASPSFLALMIQRAQILNQPVQYEWALPTNRKHNLKLGKLDYTVSNHYLQQWQQLEGVGVNAITQIPDLGTNIWGNSTLFDVPPAIYQALANLSTRLLVNAVEDVAFRCGVGITFQYNNSQAYNKFYAGVTPLLDTMKNVGAIVDYYVTMNADIDGLDQVNANSVIGKIYLVVNGVINDIYIDLIALPPSVSLDQFRS